MNGKDKSSGIGLFNILPIAFVIIVFGAMVALTVDVVLNRRHKPPLRFPVVYVGNGMEKRPRWSEYAPTLLLKDGIGEVQELSVRGGYYDEWCDSVYVHCLIGDTIR